RHAAIFMPRSGRSLANRERIARSTGMLRSAHSMRRRPSRARPRSLTSPATAWPFAAPLPRFLIFRGMSSILRLKNDHRNDVIAGDCESRDRAAQPEKFNLWAELI